MAQKLDRAVMEDIIKLVFAAVFVFLIVAFLKWIGFIPGRPDATPTTPQEERRIGDVSRQDRIPEGKSGKEDKGPSAPKALCFPLTIGPWKICERSHGESQNSAQESSGQVPPDFMGRWAGNVIQSGRVKDECEVDIIITPENGTKRVGIANYIRVSRSGNVKTTSLMCIADLILVSATYIRISVEEQLTKGKTNCVDRSVVNLTKNATSGTLEYSVRVADLSATAVLRKITP